MQIYKTINLINGKIYIGKQIRNNPNYIGSGIILKKAIEKYGKENFTKEILEYCSSKEELNSREIFWIKKLDSRNPIKGYNISKGGDGGWGCNYNRSFKERSEMMNKAMITLGEEGLRKRAKKINESLGIEGRKERSKKGRQTLGQIGMSKKALKAMITSTKRKEKGWLNKSAIEKLGKDGLSSRSKLAAKKIGSDGLHIKAQKSNHTRYHTNRNLCCIACEFCRKT